MRPFRIDEKKAFIEYKKERFGETHHEETLEPWLEANPGDVLEDNKLMLIGRQVSTNLGKFIDLLGPDAEGNTVVLELKRDRTPRDTLAEALEHAAFVSESSLWATT